MTYSTGEALLLTQVQAISAFGTTTTSRGDWRILNKGGGRSYVILRPGTFTREQRGMGGTYLNNWTTVAEVWVRYKKDGSSMTELQGRRQDVIDRFDQYRKAGDSAGVIQDVFVRSGGEVEEMWPESGGRGIAYYRQNLIIEWAEEVDQTLQE